VDTPQRGLKDSVRELHGRRRPQPAGLEVGWGRTGNPALRVASARVEKLKASTKEGFSVGARSSKRRRWYGDFFTDVIEKSPKFTSKKRVAELALLEPATRKRVRAIIADAKEHGLKLMVFETSRSSARQTELFNQGATMLKRVGVHHYGLACT
jgi:hypothetical protein